MIQITTDFSSESWMPEESQSTERNELCQLRILYPTKRIFRNEGGGKIASDGRRQNLSATSSKRVVKGRFLEQRELTAEGNFGQRNEGRTTDMLYVRAEMMGSLSPSDFFKINVIIGSQKDSPD